MIWLVVWNMAEIFFHILRMSSSQLTNSIMFQRGRAQPPTTWYSQWRRRNIFSCSRLGIQHVPSQKFRRALDDFPERHRHFFLRRFSIICIIYTIYIYCIYKLRRYIYIYVCIHIYVYCMLCSTVIADTCGHVYMPFRGDSGWQSNLFNEGF